jgi:predicted transcriptional regulator
MELTKEEYEVLYWIARNGLMDFERLSLNIDLKKAQLIVNKLEKKGLIKISYREGKIYGFMETELGNKMLEDKKYEEWYYELGD